MSIRHPGRAGGDCSARLAFPVCGLLILLLTAPPLAASTAFTVIAPDGPSYSAQLGFAVGALGDFNGDGWPDFVVGAPMAGPSYAPPGQAWLYFGGPSLDATADLVLQGETANDRFGYCVRGGGDVNGDGWSDLIVGAPFNGAGGTKAGRVYVFFGGPSADTTPDLVLTGAAANDNFGWSVAGADDLDGGGSDFVVGAPSETGSTNGKVYVYRGGSALDNVADYVLSGPSGTLFGWSVRGAGDFDADGYPDLIVGAILGKYAYLYRGGPGFDTTPDVIFAGETTGDRFGYSVAPAGDVNGDGHDDLIIGAMHNGAGNIDGGRAYVYYGGSGADTVADLVYTGSDYRGVFGRTVAGASDINHDGYDDLVVGAPTPDTGGYGPGKTFVFFGGDPGGPRPPSTTPDIVITGEHDSDRMGAQVAIVGDVTGDGRADFLAGADLFTPAGGYRNGKFYLFRVPNELPTAAPDTADTPEDAPLAIDVLANDHDLDGVLVPASTRVVTAPAHGETAVDPATGRVTYTPAPDWFGTDGFAYDVRDNENALSAPATVTVLVAPVNDRPWALPDSATTPQDSLAIIAVLANDSDPDDAIVPASVRIVTDPRHGAAQTDTVGGTIAYQPAPGFAGNDTLEYTIADSSGAASAPARVTISVLDTTPPAAVAGFTAAPGHGFVALAWSEVPADAAALEVWRAPWRDGGGGSAYPRYDDAPGAAPPTRPADRAAAAADTAWTVATVLPAGAVACADTVAARGVYHYEIFVRDAAGNYGPPATAGPRATNYRLADVALPHDGVVDTTDVALLAAQYGRAYGDAAYDAGLDVGPTDSRAATGVPLTDGVVDFEDVMIAAMNFGAPVVPPEPGSLVQFAWQRMDTSTWALRLDSPCPPLKGVRVSASLPPGVTVTVVAGPLAGLQSAPVFLQNGAADRCDIALVVLGAGAGWTGSGELLRVTLSVALDLPDPAIAARGTDNSPLPAQLHLTTGVPDVPLLCLSQNTPNPFNPATTIRFTLPATGAARLAVFDARGRRVATLVDGALPAGPHAVTWRGGDDTGATVASGVYFYRLESGSRVETRRMTLLR